MENSLSQQVSMPGKSKIVLFVMDGLGGLPMKSGGKTELETARTPNLDTLAAEGICGLHQPIAPGITPGSGPAHLALFGYNPVNYQVGRGVLSALGVDFDLRKEDVAARGNFCSVDGDGKITDRRAGRIPTEKNAELCELLRKIDLGDVEVFVQPEKEYRFLFVLRGSGLGGELSDTDPQHVGKAPLPCKALDAASEKTAKAVNRFVEQAQEILKDHHPANMLLLRGLSRQPDWPMLPDVYHMRTGAIAVYPMYRGVAKLVGMDVLKTGTTFEDEIKTLEERWNDYDFFFLHYKPTDSSGEDGDFDRKVRLIEEADSLVPRIRSLKPDVMIVTGDHSTPARMKKHSWHPVPALLWSELCRSDEVTSFGERACMRGGLGPRIPAIDLLPLAMANAGRLEKFGA